MPEFSTTWQIASVLFFAYTIAVGLLRPAASRCRALGIAAFGLVCTAFSALLPRHAWPNMWLLPPGLLLLGYWSSGGLFVRPMPGAEEALMAGDRALGIPAYGLPRWVAEILEAAYLSIYLVVGIAFVLFLTVLAEPRPERFWTVVLITDYVCFAMLPWVQTRPPRALEAREPWRSSIRTVNLRLLGSTSIHVNTWPSGHAAEAAATALLLFGAPAPVSIAAVIVALAISAGAVLGRYHYALDAAAGWLVALTVWLLVP